MRLDRTHNAKRNIVWGVLNKIITIVFPFVIRTVIIYRLGVNYVGLNSLFTSILSTLSLAELGFDTAIVTIMYKGVASNNEENLCTLLAFIRKAYYIVGTVIFFLGILCIPFLEYTINDPASIPTNINLQFLFILFLTNTVISYFFGGYKICLLQAYQRLDVISNINSISTILCSVVQIIILFYTGNYYLFILVKIIQSILINVYIYYYATNHFRNIVPKGKPSKTQYDGLKKTLSGTFLSRVGSILSVTFDNIIISSFLGLTVLACYSNYSYISSSLMSFLIIVYNSLQAGIGNSLALESKEKNYKDLLKFSFIYNWIVGWTSICLLFLFQPFISLWVGSDLLLPDIVVVMIVLNYYVVLCGGIQGTYKNAMGIWWEDRYRCLIGGLFNLILNVLMVLILRKYGSLYALAGVVLSTTISDLLILTPWSIRVTFNKLFKDGMLTYVKELLEYFAVTIINIFICLPVMKLLSSVIDNAFSLLLFSSIVLVILPNVVYFIFYHKNKHFAESLSFIRLLIKRN